MRRVLGIIVVLGLAVFLVGAGKRGFVRTTDGRVFQGEITEDRPTSILIKTAAGLTMTLPANQVAKIDYTTDIREAYRLRVADLPKDADYKAHFEIAQWMMDNKVYDLAREQALEARKMAPNEPGPMFLLESITQLIAWNASKTPTSKPAEAEKRFLDDEQVNAIRLWEMSARDAQVPVRLDNDVVKRFVEYARLEPREFAALSNFDKAIRIIQGGPSEMRKDIRVTADPPALLEYKNTIQPMVMPSCATAACHGNAKAGKFRLSPAVNNDPSVYTNFYLLTRAAISIGEKKYLMVNRVRPEESLLALYGMHPEVSKTPHPKVNGYRPLFNNYDDAKYRALIRWMGSRLVPTAPDYGFEFELPAEKSERDENSGKNP